MFCFNGFKKLTCFHLSYVNMLELLILYMLGKPEGLDVPGHIPHQTCLKKALELLQRNYFTLKLPKNEKKL